MSPMIGWLALGAVAVAAQAGQGETYQATPFPMVWRGGGQALVDLSGLLNRPAGADGSIVVKDGHLVTAGGRRLRIWGVNLTGAACYPQKEDAPAVADYLARFGVNCVRFHFLDSNWGKGGSIFAPGDATRRLDANQLDRLDWFIAQLKQRGIYSNINLNVGRVFRKADGVADHEYLGLGKAVNYFDDRVAELHREYATQLLSHANPYIKTEYRSEPAVAIVELVNENSLVESWFAGRLRGKQMEKNPGTWCDITAHYEGLLTRRFNDWLATRYPQEVRERWRAAAGVAADQPLPRLQPEQFDKAPADRFAAEAAFYIELEDAYFQRMYKHLKDLGVRALVAATSDHNHYKSGYPMLASAAKLDVVDGHIYWQHPSQTTDPVTKKRSFRIGNTPMVNEPLASTVVQLARSAVAGKPYTVSEVNHPFPSEYACEGIPILAAYALLQDWDGLFFYTFEHASPQEWATRTPGHFDIRPDPVKMAELAAGAAMFHRADVAAARQTVARSYSMTRAIESIRAPSSQRPLFTPGLPAATPLVHGLRISGFGMEQTQFPAVEAGETIVSDSGELTWRLADRKGLVTVETDRTQAIVGFVGGQARRLRNLAATVETPFCAIILTSLDGKPLGASRRMLLTAGARTAATGMKWDAQRRTLTDWGKPPMCIEPVKGELALPGRAAAGKLTATALDGAAAAMGDAQKARDTSAGPAFSLAAPTVWYLIRAEP